MVAELPTQNVLVVLNEPQRVVNIGGTVRALLNTGFRRLRLVAPVPYDSARLDDLAHRSATLVDAIETFATLDAAIADVAYVVGFTSRTRTDRRITWLNESVSTLRTLADHSPIALLFGREDRGLENVALEHCTHLVAIPTDPAYPSLNLADAVLLALYELRRAPPTPLAELPARAADHTATISLIEQTLHELHFARSGGQHAAQLRTFRDLLARAAPTPRETALLQALCRKILHRLGQTKAAEP